MKGMDPMGMKQKPTMKPGSRTMGVPKMGLGRDMDMSMMPKIKMPKAAGVKFTSKTLKRIGKAI